MVRKPLHPVYDAEILFTIRGGGKEKIFWRLIGERGIYRRSFLRSPFEDAPLGPGQRFGQIGEKYWVMDRMVELERGLMACCSLDVISDDDLIVCDQCGGGTLTAIEKPGRRVVCRPCADRES